MIFSIIHLFCSLIFHSLVFIWLPTFQSINFLGSKEIPLQSLLNLNFYFFIINNCVKCKEYLELYNHYIDFHQKKKLESREKLKKLNTYKQHKI